MVRVRGSLDVLLVLGFDAPELLLHGSVLVGHAQILLLLLAGLLLQVLEVAAGRLMAGNNLGQILEFFLQVALRLQNTLVLLALLGSLLHPKETMGVRTISSLYVERFACALQ